MPLEPHRERAQAAQPEINVIGADAAGRSGRRMFFRSATAVRIGGDACRACTSAWPPKYLVPAWIDEIDAEIERAEIERRRPGIVHQHERASGVRRRGDRRDVLHLETQRARRFDENRARVRSRINPAIAPPSQRIVIGGGHAEAREHPVAKRPRRAIDAVGDQDDGRRPCTTESSAVEIAARPDGNSDTPAQCGPSSSRHSLLRAPPWSACRGGRTGSGARWATKSSALG